MKIAVIALGKIGLPLAVQFASKGHEVVGVDVNPATVAAVNAGQEPFPGEAHLQQLLSEDAQTLIEVLKKAYEALRTCSCAASPDKDGCYRCLYQYRQARVLPSISRREAEALLGKQ